MTVAPINSQTPPYPNIHEAARIYGEWLNDRGGINGRPLEVMLCDGRGDPNEDANCGRQAADEGVVALVGSFTFDASQLDPDPRGGEHRHVRVVLPDRRDRAVQPGLVRHRLQLRHRRRRGRRRWSTTGARRRPSSSSTCRSPTSPRRHKGRLRVQRRRPDDIKFVRIPLTAQDYSAQVAQAIDGTDCIYGGISDRTGRRSCRRCSRSAARSASTATRATSTAPSPQQFPELTQDGISVTAYPNIVGPMWDDYRAALEEYDAPDLDWNSLAGLGTWAAFEAVRRHRPGDRR